MNLRTFLSQDRTVFVLVRNNTLRTMNFLGLPGPSRAMMYQQHDEDMIGSERQSRTLSILQWAIQSLYWAKNGEPDDKIEIRTILMKMMITFLLRIWFLPYPLLNIYFQVVYSNESWISWRICHFRSTLVGWDYWIAKIILRVHVTCLLYDWYNKTHFRPQD